MLKYGSWKLQLKSWNMYPESLNRTLRYIFTTTRPLAIELGKVVSYYEGFHL